VAADLNPAALLVESFRAAVEAASPAARVPAFLPEPPTGRTIVVGAGKASAAMAQTFERQWTGELSGLVVTATGHAVPCERIEVVESSHPVPGDDGLRAAERVLELVSGLAPNDLVVCLLSGGGSALLPLPASGLSLDEKQSITRTLLRAGATIGEINCVRRHLSRIKGGRLAAACHPARVVTLAISDVPGDDPVDIASGPTVADPTTCAVALAVLERYGVGISPAAAQSLRSAAWESVKPGDPRLARAEFRTIATPRQSLETAADVFRAAGVAVWLLSDRIEGEARDVATGMAALAERVIAGRHPVHPPCVLLSGGETTVTVRGSGRGGRNVEFLLAFGLALGARHSVYALAADTDGVDGMEPVAGALWRPDTLARAAAMGLDARRFLDSNDVHAFFALLGDQIITGPTRTNVNDFRAILVLDERAAPRT
jgi:hydroxypyruvate reductase